MGYQPHGPLVIAAWNSKCISITEGQGPMGVDLFSDLQPRITKDDEEATNNIITWLDNLSKTTLMGPVPKYIVFKVKNYQLKRKATSSALLKISLRISFRI